VFGLSYLVLGTLLSFHILSILCLSFVIFSYVMWMFHLEYKFLFEILEFRASKFIIIEIITSPSS